MHLSISKLRSITFAAILTLPLLASAQTEQILHSFSGKDGTRPNGKLIFDQVGNLYGTTQAGGTGSACDNNGCGTVFKMSPQTGGGWSYQVLHSFNGTDGMIPTFGLSMDSAGNLYGTTGYGGANNQGTVFELSPTSTGWTQQVLYSFTNGTDGAQPLNGVILDNAGNLYGTTSNGGANQIGAAFELMPSGSSWSIKVLLAFDNLDGTGASPLTFDADGNLYGTATHGGFGRNHQRGTIYELTKQTSGAWTSSVKFTFTGPRTYGYYPAGGIVFDGSGNIYATLSEGGYGDAFGGSIVELLPSIPQYVDWRTFTRFPASPHPPLSPVALDSANNIYVAISGGGASVCYGAILKIGTNVFEIYNFSANPTDGHFPQGGIVLDAQNNVYGATSSGGGKGYGTIFKITF